MSDILKIFVATHNTPIKEDDTFVPIQVGAAKHPYLNLCQTKDDTMDNISEKNGYYCELSAMYWIWKNAKKVYPNLKYVGLCHYRRWFDFGSDAELLLNHPEQFFTEETIVAFTKEPWWKKTMRLAMYEDYLYQDYDSCMAIMFKRNPEWYKFSDKYFNTEKQQGNNKNSFIMPWNLFDKMCNDLFGILFEHDEYFNITPSNYTEHAKQPSPYRKRYSEHLTRFNGYISEILVSSWINYHAKIIKEYNYQGTNPYNPTQIAVDKLKNDHTKPDYLKEKMKARQMVAKQTIKSLPVQQVPTNRVNSNVIRKQQTDFYILQNRGNIRIK